jgi:predicted  nucleic acid-binding Zn-ribbon protein
MAHSCAECGHAYDDTVSEAGTASDRCCPECGSDRVNASVAPATVEARTTVPTPSILLTAHLWITWLRVAIERAQQARRVREEMVRRRDQGANAAELLNDEFEASIVAVAASAHALDALYGSAAIPQSVRAQWRHSSSSREGHIREALKGVFDTGRVNTPWVTEFGWLFDLRDSAAHAREEAKSPQPHPIVGNTSQEYVTYSAESAEPAVEFALSVFRWCVDHPRPALSVATQWATAMRPVIEELEAQRLGRTS